jgi:beta-galactosidase
MAESEGEQTRTSAQPAPKIERYNLRVEGTLLPLYSGSIDYWRIDRASWSKVLDGVRGLGFRIISTSVPWNIHETPDRRFDFGTGDERKDLDAFLTLCHEKKLYAIVQPGPAVSLQVAALGYPERIVNNPAIQAQSAQGTQVIIPAAPLPFPMPSYASERFYDEVSKYFDAVCPILVRHQTPGGAVIGIQVDNELPLLFMHGPFSADYSPAALRWYYEFLGSKYSSIDALNQAYRTRYGTFPEVAPPRALATSEREALPRYLDWVQFQEYYVVLALSVIASLLWARGIRGLLTHHNVESVYPELPLKPLDTEKELDVQGVGLRLGRNDYDVIRRGALYMTTVSRLPFLAKASIGSSPWSPALTPDDQEFALLVALMYGFRGFNIHMLVEGSRWTGSPIDRNGQRNEKTYAFLQRLLTVLENLQFNTLQRTVPVLLLRNFEYERLGILCGGANWITNLLGIPAGLLTSTKTFGYSEVVQLAYPAHWEALYWGLTRSKIPFQIGDTDLDRPALSHYRAVLLPTYDYMSEELQRKVLEYVERGGVAIIGPGLPYLGTDMRTCTVLSDVLDYQVTSIRPPLVGLHDTLAFDAGAVRLGSRTAGKAVSYGRGTLLCLGVAFPPTTRRDEATDAERIVTQALQPLQLASVGDLRAPLVDEAYWGARTPSVVFAANSSNQPTSVTVQVPQRLRIREAWTGELLADRGTQEVELLPHQVKILEVVR